jgi:hypothetical protein
MYKKKKTTKIEKKQLTVIPLKEKLYFKKI